MANLTNSAKLIEEMNKKAYTQDLATVATTGAYSDLTGQPTIPTVNNSTIKIQKNSADVDSFTTNASSGKTINITMTKSDVGLGNVDNTSDASKPISNATQTALNAKADANSVYTKAEVDSAISSAVSSVYKYKGSVANYASLPTTGLTVGDVYNVEDTGDNYAWTGIAWDKLAGTVDLSSYLTKSEASSTYATKTEVNAKADTSSVLTKTNTTSFTPTADYHPATKKYVDDTASGKVSDTAYASSWNGVTNVAPSKNAVYDKINGMISDTAYGSSWNGVTTVAPSKNAVYDKIETLPNAAGNGIDITNKAINARVGKGLEIGNDYSAMQGPCPDGFHVPTSTEWNNVINAGNTMGIWNTTKTNFGLYLKIPLAGCRGNTDTNTYGQGSRGNYWTGVKASSTSNTSSVLKSQMVSTGYGDQRSYGYSIRAFKDNIVIPDSSWTTLYDGSSTATGAGIFHNASLGIISISSDGTTWYTIADKNVGATTVYNDGDTLTEANCGGYFQWGNNYMFPWTGTVSNTSSTQIDASGYGPGNYYSSDIYRTTNSDRSSVKNNNLWGGETGVISNAIINAGVTSVNGETGDVTNVVTGDGQYVINVSTTAPASGTASNIITFVIDS